MHGCFKVKIKVEKVNSPGTTIARADDSFPPTFLFTLSLYTLTHKKPYHYAGFQQNSRNI